MKVCIDIDVLAHDRKTGVYQYNQRLLQALLKLDDSNIYTLTYFGQPNTAASFGLPAARAAIRAVKWFPRKLYNLSLRTPFGLPYDLMTGEHADLFIFTKFVRWPLLRRGKSLAFVYDTAFVDYPELIETWHFRRYLNWAVPRSLPLADRIIVISESTKRSLVEHYGTPPDKITVITPAIDPDEFRPATEQEIDRVKNKYGISQPYVLSVGTLEPRKNLAGLLRALAKVPDEIKRNHTLVLAGGKGWLDEDMNRQYAELSRQMNTVKTGYVANEDLPALYSGAQVFVYPSLYEGFGMPPLEAMACGTPVIVANNSSLPEVVGDAGVLVDAHDIMELARQIERVLRDPAWAASLSKQGLKRAQAFRWDESARKLLDIINNTGANK